MYDGVQLESVYFISRKYIPVFSSSRSELDLWLCVLGLWFVDSFINYLSVHKLMISLHLKTLLKRRGGLG